MTIPPILLHAIMYSYKVFLLHVASYIHMSVVASTVCAESVHIAKWLCCKECRIIQNVILQLFS